MGNKRQTESNKCTSIVVVVVVAVVVVVDVDCSSERLQEQVKQGHDVFRPFGPLDGQRERRAWIKLVLNQMTKLWFSWESSALIPI